VENYHADTSFKESEIARKKIYKLTPQAKLLSRVHSNRRRGRQKSLPDTLTSVEWQSILADFDGKCALTNSTHIHMEHFIPISSGCGGTYVGNVYLMDGNLNLSKSGKNPFEWIRQPRIKLLIDIEKWNSLVAYLAAKNEMSVDTFVSFVYSCFENKIPKAANC